MLICHIASAPIFTCPSVTHRSVISRICFPKYKLTAPIVTTAGHAIGQIRFRLDGCKIAGAGHKGGNGGQDELLRAWELFGLNT